MIVKDLIALLQTCDPDAEVFLASQPGWPFEYAVAGVAVRERVLRREQRDGDEPSALVNGERLNDVLLAEGQQLRYGSRAIWDVARTR